MSPPRLSWLRLVLGTRARKRRKARLLGGNALSKNEKLKFGSPKVMLSATSINLGGNLVEKKLNWNSEPFSQMRSGTHW
jgi:hypothetical protein